MRYSNNMNPFGETCCEEEIIRLKDKYSQYYFKDTPFNERSLESESYLIIGRRGAGKTSLTRYFSFQPKYKNCKCLNLSDVDGQNLYLKVFKEIISHERFSNSLAISQIVNIWDYAIWCFIFQEYFEYDKVIASASLVENKKNGREVIKKIISKLIDKSALDDLEEIVRAPLFESAKKKVIDALKRNPIIIAIDSLEDYPINDDVMMNATAALIECASKLNREYSWQGLHIKVFITDEIFPHLHESVISNSVKYVKNEVYLHWRPKDLLRLVSWRFNRYLCLGKNPSQYCNEDVDWLSFSDVVCNVWEPFFGKELINGFGHAEKTFPYILRHTQMRPRQLVYICNEIANCSMELKSFPLFNSDVIVATVKNVEVKLATEVINSYKDIYPNVARIIDSLRELPIMFKGNHLDKIAKKSSSFWPDKDYSPDNFRHLVAQLGIVGKVRHYDERTHIAEADFEYALEDRLPLSVEDTCVIHPMFFYKLQIDLSQKIFVYPFPRHRDYDEIRASYGCMKLDKSLCHL